MRKLFLATAVCLFAFPAIAEPAAAPPAASVSLTAQECIDISLALQRIGRDCSGDDVPACQAGADGKAIQAKIAAAFAELQKAKK